MKDFTEKRGDDLSQNFASVFASDYLNRFISFHNSIADENARHLLMIVNIDEFYKNGTHWMKICIQGSKSFSLLVFS